jgi:hypothetical protein
MNTEIHLNPTHIAGSSAEKAAVLEFENTLNECIKQWQHGNNGVVLQGNLHERFGDMLLQYFQRKLIEEVGAPAAITFSDTSSGQQTLVQMPQPERSQVHLQTQSEVVAQTETSEQTTTQAASPTVDTKKTPRPMNCWIIFRDRMYRQLKAEHPNLRVQDICKHLIRTLSLTSSY